ncbi:MAG: DNA repair protein RadC [Brevinematales bacterium]|nr:DNA repair protein RadC [Brevinematales bacterium]
MVSHTPIKAWREEDRPREKLLAMGARHLSTTELLAIIVRTGSGKRSAMDVAMELLERFGGLRGLEKATIQELSQIQGIGKTKAIEIKALCELAKRFVREEAKKVEKITSVEEALHYIQNYYGPFLRDENREIFSLVLLDVRHHPLCHLDISQGSAYATVVDPREVVRQICLYQASSVILIHNHPSGDASPSKDDENLTQKLASACEMVGARVLDHIIVGKNWEDYYSFAMQGKL